MSLGLLDWQYHYNGLTFGVQTPYRVAKVAGLGELPDVSSSDDGRAQEHGLHPGRDLLDGLVPEFDLVVGSGDIAADLAALRRATVVSPDVELPLTYKWPGLPERRVLCRPRRRQVPTVPEQSVGRVQAAVQFAASDPRTYAEDESSLALTLPSAAGGLSWPLTWPLAWGVATSGAALAVNAGDFETWPVARLDGPLTRPTLENVTTGRTFRTSLELAAGEFLLVDFAARAVLLNGTASRRAWVMGSSQWWSLAPGVNEVKLGGIAGAGSMTLTWRSAWA